jgi:hypothetical protein
MYRRTLLAAPVLGGLNRVAAASCDGHSHGLGTAPVRKRLGVYKGAGCDGRAALAGFIAWLGRRPEWMLDFLAQENWQDFDKSASWIVGCWRGADQRLALAVPMLTGDRRNTLALGASGAYDQHFRRLAQILTSSGRGDSVIRLGWEFNGSWSHWCPVQEPATFIAYWRRIVAIMRSVPEAHFRFDWNPTLGRAAVAPDLVYPGDDVTDIIGLDVYNQSWSTPRPSAHARWEELRRQPFGLDWHRAFAEAKGKPRSFPDWGTGRRPDGSGGGDDPLFITEMARWVTAPDVAYHGYWDYPASDYFALISTGQFPRAAAAFCENFGEARRKS